ncbi:Beta-hydroxyacid dehydrogenase, 3-hydroxyisobutyrate dehydrogenase [Cupriavidus taiwanensis]|uniref:NAD(P)-dependent oxidoreductase n=1 Tax=Cupriavidus taiwanensis TaxID=164546 RepID=UPI000E17E936|nr:NAD(P)-dependent oxidoreductase [Cupriavidus taiwanensis]SPA33155.1 Beta-hydroxyacid dehydrogenase, 3-hydroxyisobutyrate dehydrogenase [Cupriavidus taiwanensis]
MTAAGAETRLGFIGLGVMGAPMCANLTRKAGVPVIGFDADPARTAIAAEAGALVAGSVAQVAGQADVVFLCLADGAATEAVGNTVLDGWHTSGRRGMLVDMGTTSIHVTRRLAARAHATGQRFADAPVARMPEAAALGTLSIMVGGCATTVADLTPWLRCMGTDITHCGPAGTGQVVKILHNSFLFETVHALAEALAVARRHGVAGEVLFDAMELGSANCNAVRVQGRQALLPGDYPAGRFPARYALKDVSLALELAETVQVDAVVGRHTAELLRKACEAGAADRYYPVLYTLIGDAPGPGRT